MNAGQFDAQLETLIQQAQSAGISVDQLIERLLSAVDRLEDAREVD